MVQSITMLPESMVQTKWQYSAELPPSISEGVYKISYKRKSEGPEGTTGVVYLNPRKTNNNAIATTDDSTAAWYVRNYNGQMYIISCGLQSDGRGDNVFGSLIFPYSDGKGAVQNANGMLPTTLVFANTDLGGIIYSTQTGEKLVPINTGASADDNYIVPFSGAHNVTDSDTYGWVFERISCASTGEIAPGNYVIQKGTEYLQVAESGELRMVNTPPTPANFRSYVWTYSGNKLFNCNNMAVAYNPASPLAKVGSGESEIVFGQVVQCSSSASSPVKIMQWSSGFVITLDEATSCGLNTVNIQGSQIPIAMSCISSVMLWTLTSFEVPPPASIGSGIYQLKQGSNCISRDGQLTDQCGSDSYWSYDGVSKLMHQVTGQCLINPSAGICDMKDLVVGSCDNPGAARFVLGQGGNMYDPVTHLCYSGPGGVESYSSRRNDVVYRENFDIKRSKDWLIPLIFVIVILFVLVVVKRR